MVRDDDIGIAREVRQVPGVESIKKGRGKRRLSRVFDILKGNGWMGVEEITDDLETKTARPVEKYLDILLELGLVEVRVSEKGMSYRGVDLDERELEIVRFILRGLGANPSLKMREDALAVLSAPGVASAGRAMWRRMFSATERAASNASARPVRK